MSEAATIEAPAAAPAAPAASPAPVAQAPAPAAPATAPAPASLFTAAAPAAPAAPAQAPAVDADPWTKVPEKYVVKGADGAVDHAQTLAKLTDGYSAAVKRIGTGDLPPDTPDKYTFTKPEALKDVALDDTLTADFKERAHKAGLTNAQFEFVMGEYFEMVPSVLGAAAAVTAEEARAELQKVWTAPADFQANLAAGQRAVSALPENLQKQIVEGGLGTNPVMAQVLAAFGREMREDRPPGAGGAGQSTSSTVEQLMRHPAYRDAKHPEHQAISQRVVDLQRRAYGDAPAN